MNDSKLCNEYEARPHPTNDYSPQDENRDSLPLLPQIRRVSAERMRAADIPSIPTKNPESLLSSGAVKPPRGLEIKTLVAGYLVPGRLARRQEIFGTLD